MNSNRFTISGSWGLLKLALALFLLLALSTPCRQDSLAVGATIYVDVDATGLNDGSSWPNAFTDLQPALDAALSGDEIWVAAGTYTPTVEHGGSGNNRYRSFQLKNGVALYGGFDPSVGDIAFEDRDWALHETILSGDLNGDDGPDFANNAENSYHVFYHPLGAYLDSSAVLDGFTVTGGNANAQPYDYSGGGMFNDQSSSPTLTNCTFYGNWAGKGGGMDNRHSSNPTLTNCTFSNNSAGEGGGMHNWYSSPMLTNCTFLNNSAGDGGGGMANIGSSPTLTNCTFSNNSVSGPMWGGGGMANDSSLPTLTNCTFYGNSGEYGGGMVNNFSSSPTLTNCTFWGNSGSLGGGILNINDSSPALTNCILWGDSATEMFTLSGTPVITHSNIQGGYDGVGNIDAYPSFVDPDNGDFHLGPCSPCIDAGDNSAEGLAEYDFEGDGRILDGDGDGTATVDMGVDEVAVAGTCFRVYLPVVMRNH